MIFGLPKMVVNTSRLNVTATVGAGNLTLSWPADHTGWRLLTQTNRLTRGLGTNRTTVANSSSTNTVTFPLPATQAACFMS